MESGVDEEKQVIVYGADDTEEEEEIEKEDVKASICAGEDDVRFEAEEDCRKGSGAW